MENDELDKEVEEQEKLYDNCMQALYGLDANRIIAMYQEGDEK